MLLAAIASLFLMACAQAEDIPADFAAQTEIPAGLAEGDPDALRNLGEVPASQPEAVGPSDVPPTETGEDYLGIFPDPPAPLPDRRIVSMGAMVQQLSWAGQTICAGRDDCIRIAGNLARFLWNNRDKADMSSRAAMCLGQSAVRRGYVSAPIEAIRNASAAEMMTLSVEICECVIGFWKKIGLCRPALVQGNLAPLMRLFDR